MSKQTENELGREQKLCILGQKNAIIKLLKNLIYLSLLIHNQRLRYNTPYYKGEVLALCVENPLVGLIIGNIPGARERNNPDINWVPALAVQTRAQAKREGETSKLKTPSLMDIIINPAQVSNAQKEDVSLTTTRSRCEANETIGKAIFLKKNNL